MANGKLDSPPYVAWSRLAGFLKGFKEHGVPPRIDGSLMSGMSGTDQSLVRGALRFFGLVTGENDSTTPRTSEVVEALGTDAWATEAAQLVDRYATIAEGVDFSTGTQAQLESAFRVKGNISGSVLDKAVRLYLTLRDEAKLPSSPYFKTRAKQSATANGSVTNKVRKTRRPRMTPPAQETGAIGGNRPAPEGAEDVQFSIPGGKQVRMWLPKGLTAAELKFVTRYLNDYLKNIGT